MINRGAAATSIAPVPVDSSFDGKRVRCAGCNSRLQQLFSDARPILERFFNRSPYTLAYTG